MTMNDIKAEMNKEASRIHESAMYSAQTQFAYSKSWRSVDRWLGGFAALVAATSAAGGLSTVLSARWTGLIALVSAGAGAVASSLGAPKTKTQAHASANAYLALQQDARNFINIDLPKMNVDEARDQLGKLIARQQELNATTEIPSGRAWRKAKSEVEGGNQKYEVDA